MRLNGKYPLQKGDYESVSECKAYSDNRFSKLGVYSNSEKTVLINAYGSAHYDLFPTVDRGSAIYSTQSAYDFNYFGRKYVQWSMEEDCRAILEPMFIAKDNFDLASSCQLFVLVINILVLIILGVVFPIMSILNICGYDLDCIKGSDEDEYKMINKIKKVASYGCKTLQLPFMIVAIVTIKKVLHIYSDTADSQCSGTITNLFFNRLDKLMKEDVYQKNVNQIIALCLMVLLDIILAVREKS